MEIIPDMGLAVSQYLCKVLIFSRDRGMQLDASIRSFIRHCHNCAGVQIHVLYCATSPQHARQYDSLKQSWPEVKFTKQGDFRRDVLQILNPYSTGSLSLKLYLIINYLTLTTFNLERLPIKLWHALLLRLRMPLLQRLIPKPPGDSYILFLVDDNIFVRDFSLKNIAKALRNQPDSLGYSFRLGSNTTYCYALDQPQSIPEFEFVNSGFLKFNWTQSKLDFAYPLEVSSSLYRVRDIFTLIAIQPFANPNELEYQIAVSAQSFTKKMPYLLCPERSYTFCNPVNVVQNFAANRVGDNAEYTSERLADLFDQGFRINVDTYAGFVPKSCHQEVSLEFYQPEQRENGTPG